MVGKCVSFSLVVPGARLFTKEMNAAILKGHLSFKLIRVCGALREEISHWLFLETWDDPLPWRDERHVRVSVATDASNLAWERSLISPVSADISDYWTDEEQSWVIATKEATALERVVLAFQNQLRNSRVDALVDNQAVVQAWNNQSGKSGPLNEALKRLFFTTVELNVSLHLSYISTNDNPVDTHSRRLSTMDSKLCPALWKVVEQEFGGLTGHTCDLMPLDSNGMKDKFGKSLPQCTPCQTPASSGVNLFAQDLSRYEPFLERLYIFPPSILVGLVLCFLKSFRRSCSVLVLDVCPRKYWWPLIQCWSTRSLKLARKGDS